MPGDTLVVLNNVDTVAIPDSPMAYKGSLPPLRPVEAAGGVDPVWLVLGFFLLLFVGGPLLARFWKRYRHRRLQREALEGLDSNYAKYDEWLAGYNNYYKSLDTPLRKRFLLRVIEFMETKHFEYIDITPDEKMPLLISAAAIQITFGLDKYLLDFLDTIYVLQHDYHYGMYKTPFVGHVNRNGIYLSWDNFLRGFADDSDGDNVGIHEMAHALAYVNFMADENDGEDDEFKERFRAFSQVARPIFENMQQGGDTILDGYAATNYNEFWAVSVETFFEKSLRMKVQMPELYNALCTLLRQDPLLEGKLQENTLS
ncbi:MAG TPA: zinc-dependent peptidase [Chitinophagaceae bacterium]|jgi:hypothetical protein